MQVFDQDFKVGTMGVGIDNCQDLYITSFSVESLEEEQQGRPVDPRLAQNRNAKQCVLYREDYRDLLGKY